MNRNPTQPQEDRNQMNPIESPFAPDLSQLSLLARWKDKLTSSQNVSKTLSPAEIASLHTTMHQCMVYIVSTKQVINALHEVVDGLKKQKELQRNLLKHCLTQLENPKPRNQDIIIKAIKQQLGEN